jgi:starch synthase
LFKKYNAEEMLKEIKKALKIFQNKEEWKRIMKNGMKSDFSWNSSAKKYVELYKTVINN